MELVSLQGLDSSNQGWRLDVVVNLFSGTSLVGQAQGLDLNNAGGSRQTAWGRHFSKLPPVKRKNQGLVELCPGFLFNGGFKKKRIVPGPMDQTSIASGPVMKLVMLYAPQWAPLTTGAESRRGEVLASRLWRGRRRWKEVPDCPGLKWAAPKRGLGPALPEWAPRRGKKIGHPVGATFCRAPKSGLVDTKAPVPRDGKPKGVFRKPEGP